MVVQSLCRLISEWLQLFHSFCHFCLDDLSEKRKDEILIHDVDPLALTLLVDFAYTGEIVVTEENVQVIIFSVVEKLLYKWYGSTYQQSLCTK